MTSALLDSRINLERFKELDSIVREHAAAFIAFGEALMEIKQSRLWRLKYPTWREYCQSIHLTDGRVNQLIRAAGTANDLIEAGLPAPTNETQIRPISGPSVDAQAVWKAATQQHGDRPTGKQVKQVKQAMTDPDADTRRRVREINIIAVTQKMETGELTPQAALALASELKSCAPKVTGHMVMYDVENITVIRELNRRRKTETYAEIMASGYLQFAERSLPLKQATPQDVRDLFDERHAEHRRQAAVERDAQQGITAHVLTLLAGPDEKTMQRNVDALKTAIGEERLKRLAEYVLHGVIA